MLTQNLFSLKWHFQVEKTMNWTPSLSMAIPASLVSDTPHLREKTYKIGMIGRAAAIFRVEEIVIYPDQPEKNQRKDAKLIELILSYMETPQYLRKRMFKLRPELRYVGVLPPLRTPHHPTTSLSEELEIGEYREGIVISSTRKGSNVYIGVEKPAFIKGIKLPSGKRVTVKIEKLNRGIEAVLAQRDEIKDYWGYKVVVSERSLGGILKNWDLIVATSKYGIPFIRVKDELIQKWKKAKRRIVLFGSPSAGLYEILELEGLNLDEIADFVVNTIPSQGVETVRTEEAVYASLAIFNLFLSSNNQV